MMFGLPGAALAIYQTSPEEKKKKVKALMIAGVAASFVSGIHRTNGIFLYVHCTNVILISFYYGWYLFHADVSFRSYCRKYWGGIIDFFIWGVFQPGSLVLIPIVGVFTQ